MLYYKRGAVLSVQYYYYSSIRKTIIMFLDMFRNIRIARYNSNGILTGYRKVPLKLGIKEKVWYWLHERKYDKMLPMMSVILSSVEYAPERQGSKMRRIVKSSSHSIGEVERFLNPIPYDFSFTTTVWSLHVVDIDQILEQVLPFFVPDRWIRINIPELDTTLNLKVLFKSCSPDINYEMSDEEIRVLKWNMEFIVQGYLFQPVESEPLIHKVIQKIYGNEHSWGHRFTESEFTSGSGYEMAALFTKAISPYFDEDDWQPNVSYEVGDLAKPTTPNGFLYEVQSVLLPGKSGLVEPTWPTFEGKPVVDNDIIWERYEHDEYKRLTTLEIFED